MKKRQWLIDARINTGMTQTQIASILEISQTTYARYELGTRNYTGKTALRLSRIFNIPLEKFFDIA